MHPTWTNLHNTYASAVKSEWTNMYAYFESPWAWCRSLRHSQLNQHSTTLGKHSNRRQNKTRSHPLSRQLAARATAVLQQYSCYTCNLGLSYNQQKCLAQQRNAALLLRKQRKRLTMSNATNATIHSSESLSTNICAHNHRMKNAINISRPANIKRNLHREQLNTQACDQVQVHSGPGHVSDIFAECMSHPLVAGHACIALLHMKHTQNNKQRSRNDKTNSE